MRRGWALLVGQKALKMDPGYSLVQRRSTTPGYSSVGEAVLPGVVQAPS